MSCDQSAAPKHNVDDTSSPDCPSQPLNFEESEVDPGIPAKVSETLPAPAVSESETLTGPVVSLEPALSENVCLGNDTGLWPEFMIPGRSKEMGRIDQELTWQADVAKYWQEVLRRFIFSENGLAFRGENQTFGSPSNDNYLGLLEHIAEYDDFLSNH
ncbi:hypothetical protein PR048_013254 [Dryococelus australis]|uniref:Uncharacterized protein n=1 Tax=Dryococelus australis TaxID=614101 RepID=A0ABQ9HRN4_9NEOP|nr:hypothetical protein PR048_013254 [Dryococelus australis]